jgi:ADP-dependent NAD(P)H-hydrate dehydratase
VCNPSAQAVANIMQPDLSTTVEMVVQLPVLPPRPPDSNKGMFGRVLVVAGSRGMSGAAVLCASAALRGGAGLVYLAVPQEIQPQVAVANPCYLTAGLPQDEQGSLSPAAEAGLLALCHAKDVIACGPGLGRSPAITAIILALIPRAPVPLVIDADGLNALAGQTDRLRQRQPPVILTPHPGEFARLLNTDVPTVQSQRRQLAVRFALEHHLVLVLKGHVTIVTDGRRLYENGTGNPGMATGGTGDVLTGLIAALLGQRLEPFAAAQLGVYLHGLAGDLARDEVGEVSLIASDLLTHLPRAFLAGGGPTGGKVGKSGSPT